jgi:hypothetical protein
MSPPSGCIEIPLKAPRDANGPACDPIDAVRELSRLRLSAFSGTGKAET